MAPRTLSLLVLCALVIALGFRVQSLRNKGELDKVSREQATYQTIRSLMHERYVHELSDEDEKRVFFGAMDGMASAMDPHTQFLTPEMYQWLKMSTEGKFEGLGIEITMEDKKLTVVTPLLDSPAYKGHVLPGDKILKIDDTATDGLSIDECQRKMRGPQGTDVKLQVLHDGEKDPVEINLVRAKIDLKAIPEEEMLGKEYVAEGEPKLGYVQMAQFQQNTAEDLEAALKRLEAQGMRGLVIDLRENPGGLLEEAKEVADLFLKDGPIVTVITREAAADKTLEEVQYARPEGTHPEYPIAILVDSRSASASEVVSGCLQDRQRAVLVGDRTYGKFSVQEVYRVGLGNWGEAALKMTIAKYKTPKGACIDGQGIVPDYPVPFTAEQQKGLLLSRYWQHLKKNDPRAASSPDFKPKGLKRDVYEPFDDTQLKKAVEVLEARLKSK